MELVTRTAPVELPQRIQNFDEIKSYLTDATVKYRDLVITASEVKNAEKELADLRKLRDFIDTQRKEAKKQYMEQLKPLEDQYKELSALVIAPINAIDSQVKEFREEEKQKKYDELKEYFELINDVPFLRFESVLNPKYGNKSVSMNTLKTELAFSVKKVADDYDEINALYKDAPYLVAVQKKFADTLEKDTALAYAAVLSRQYEQQNRTSTPEDTQNVPVSPSPQNNEVIPPAPQNAAESGSEPYITGRFEVTGTRKQIIALGEYMRSQGIKFTTIK